MFSRPHTALCPMVLGLAHLLSGGVLGQSSDALKDRFLAEAPPKWREFETFSKQIQGTVVFRLKSTQSDRAPEEARLEYRIKQNAESALFVRMDEGGKGVDQQVHGMNPKYSFRLIRPDASRDWLLDSLKQPSDLGIAFANQTVREEVFAAVGAHFHVGLMPLVKLVADPSFVVKRVEAVPRDGQEMVRIEFGFQPRMEEGRYHGLSGGWLILDPAHDWYIRECETNQTYPDGSASDHHEFLVQPDRKAHPLLKGVGFRSEMKGQKLTGTRDNTGEYELTIDPDVPDTEFTLTAFGLPEPAGVTWERRPRTWRWLVGAGVGAFVVSMFLFWARARRHRPAGVAG